MLSIKELVSPRTTATSRTVQHRSKSATDRNRAGLVSLDNAAQIIDVNAGARKLLNCPDADLSGRDFWDAVLPAVAEQHQGQTSKAMVRHEKYSFVAHSEFEDNWLEYTFSPCQAGYIVNLRDVPVAQNLQLQLAESEFTNRLLFEAHPTAMWVFDVASLNVLAVNQAAVDFYGISKKDFLNLTIGALFPDGSGSALLDSARKTQKPPLALQICKQLKGNGEVVLVELACGHMVWRGHQAMLVSLVDMTERHVSDRRLRRENTELKQMLSSQGDALKDASRDVTAFNYALSHDLQAPLHAANGFAAVLVEKYSAILDDSARHYINRIQATTRRMAGLVDDLRMLVQLPAMSGSPEKIDVMALCTALVDDLRAKDSGRIVTVELEISLSLTADKRLVTTALSCLLENAWKFTSKKHDGWIKVSLAASLSARKTPGELVLQVSDNGTGFDDAYSDRLFTAFQRLHSSADFTGNGLGLAIVKRVAERHGGRVWAETSPTGASFFMAFPQVQNEAISAP